jgi:hypothetical protein
MTDLLLQIAVSNLCISLALAIIAWAVHTTGKRPFVAHLLWLLVLAKLVTPPIVTVPLIAVPGLSTATAETLTDLSGPGSTAIGIPVPDQDTERANADSRRTIAAPFPTEHAKAGLLLLWGFGSLCVFAWSLVRVYRFNRLLRMGSNVGT